MKDEQMQPLLEVWLRDRDAAPRDANGGVARVVANVPQTRQRGRWWPLPAFDRPVSTFPSRELAPVPIPATNGRQPARRFTMFSALKFIAAAAIVALFGGFLLAGILTTPQDSEVLPAAVTESPAQTFPTGTFLSVENDRVMLEFSEGGHGMVHRSTSDSPIVVTYAVDGDVYTELTNDEPASWRYDQPTYAWDYDGDRLAFELLGEDDNGGRKWTYTANTYRPVKDPVFIVVASRDIDAGATVHTILHYAPASEVGPDVYTSESEVVGHVAAVPLSEGQPITPDLLEPAE